MAAPPLPLTVEAAPGRPQTNAETGPPNDFPRPDSIDRAAPPPPSSLSWTRRAPPSPLRYLVPGSTHARERKGKQELTLQPCSSSHRCCPVRKLEAFPKERGAREGISCLSSLVLSGTGEALSRVLGVLATCRLLSPGLFRLECEGRNLLTPIGTPLDAPRPTKRLTCFPRINPGGKVAMMGQGIFEIHPFKKKKKSREEMVALDDDDDDDDGDDDSKLTFAVAINRQLLPHPHLSLRRRGPDGEWGVNDYVRC